MPRPPRPKKTGAASKPAPPAVARRLAAKLDIRETPAVADVALDAQVDLLTDLLALLDESIAVRQRSRLLTAEVAALREFRTRLHGWRARLQAHRQTFRYVGRRKDTPS